VEDLDSSPVILDHQGIGHRPGSNDDVDIDAVILAIVIIIVVIIEQRRVLHAHQPLCAPPQQRLQHPDQPLILAPSPLVC
jgi:hypothetical protein